MDRTNHFSFFKFAVVNDAFVLRVFVVRLSFHDDIFRRDFDVDILRVYARNSRLELEPPILLGQLKGRLPGDVMLCLGPVLQVPAEGASVLLEEFVGSAHNPVLHVFHLIENGSRFSDWNGVTHDSPPVCDRLITAYTPSPSL